MAFLRYSLLRLALIVVVFLLCYGLGLGLLFSAVVAVIVAWALSYLFFRSWRDAASADLYNRFGRARSLRTATEKDDAAAEDLP